MITLIQFYPAFGLPNASPFCLKVETYCRMANIPYKNQYTFKPKDSPTGKFPALRDGDQLISDSYFILEYLKEKYHNKLDQHLNEAQKATALAFTRLIDEHLYWGMVYTRWLMPSGWAVLGKAFFGKLPLILKLSIPRLLRRKAARQLEGQGFGRMTEQQIMRRCCDDLNAIHNYLSDKAFFFGDEPSSIDASLYGILANFLYPPIDSPLRKAVQNNQRLSAYCDRIRQRFWPDDEKNA